MLSMSSEKFNYREFHKRMKRISFSLPTEPNNIPLGGAEERIFTGMEKETPELPLITIVSFPRSPDSIRPIRTESSAD